MPNENSGEFQGLDGLIQGTTYQGQEAVTSEPDGQGGDDNRPGGSPNDGLSPAATNATGTSTGSGQQDGVTNQPSWSSGGEPAYDPREEQINALTEQIQNQSRYIYESVQQQRQAEEAGFRRSLEAMEPEDRQAAMDRRRLQQIEQQNQNYRQQNQQYRQQVEQQQAGQQESAKRTLAMMVAQDYDIPGNLQSVLLGAQNMQEMESMANTLRSQFSSTQQQQPPNPAHIGGGEQGSSNIQPEIERGSGDLMGLIQKSEYQVVPMR